MAPRTWGMKPLGSTCVRNVSQVPVDVGAEPTWASLQSGRVGIFVTGPKTLTYRSVPLNGLLLGLVVGVAGAPTALTTAVVGVAPVRVVGWVAFPLFHDGIWTPF